jgi:nucleotide-binding universal stress UspA family protein
MYKKILIATDGSEHTVKAIQHSIMLAKATGAKLTALFVIDSSSFSTLPPEVMWENIHEMLEKEGEKAVKFVVDEGKKKKVKVTTKILDGAPADVIVKESEKYDLVITGTLGRTGLSRLLLGSVAEKVVKMAKCPVMVIKSTYD